MRKTWYTTVGYHVVYGTDGTSFALKVSYVNVTLIVTSEE